MNTLPAATVEGHVLASLRVLGLYRATTFDERLPYWPQIQALSQNLRAIGFALEQRHGSVWPSLLRQAQIKLGMALELEHRDDVLTADRLLLVQALSLLLDLKHGPPDAHLAAPGLGLSLIKLAVTVEHLLVLSLDSDEPQAPDLAFPLPSTRGQVLLEVARHLAALELQSMLPRGHHVTVADLRGTAVRLRETLPSPGQEQGPGAQLVVQTESPTYPWKSWFFNRGQAPEPVGTVALTTHLLRSLVTRNDSALVSKHDAALAVGLDDLAASLVPADLTPS
ncbi:hypothetical protein [Deinococcus aestuarii]|uniref:hypothetical protein n=1 Tax=Deinococcus aestuarii TaxID=2774531 RepID=UPI001C0DCE6B|nr:hypothetical protein [Deinococcus aestuarii]